MYVQKQPTFIKFWMSTVYIPASLNLSIQQFQPQVPVISNIFYIYLIFSSWHITNFSSHLLETLRHYSYINKLCHCRRHHHEFSMYQAGTVVLFYGHWMKSHRENVKWFEASNLIFEMGSYSVCFWYMENIYIYIYRIYIYRIFIEYI